VRSPIKDFSDDDYWLKKSEAELPADFKSREELETEIEKLTVAMKKKAANLDFKTAAQLRDRIKTLKNLLIEMF
jgi:excinuclease ABC subunit B